MKGKVGRVPSSTAIATIVLLFLRVVVLMHGSNKTGICMRAEKTRTGRACQGRLYTVNSEISRVKLLPINSRLCRYHWDVARRENLRCACPKQDYFKHSRLNANKIPQRFYAVFGRWCNLCKQTADEDFKNHQLYASAARAKECDKENEDQAGKTSEVLSSPLQVVTPKHVLKAFLLFLLLFFS
ncbi:uncharacterized protein LOC116300488 [Actinia tenebrosa]|uniref:Uncharacterized protein LOC116300488 n=1 Tax=Actinia tenebrosa TaxID=6105 RepID=A0A6P8I9G6_ACTTE|nr:uncharacterized protein LOC116300488 [Actinia tenebrosa]